MKVITEMHRILRLQSQLFGYHDPKGNPRGMCSLLTWTEILHMFLCLKDPFVHNCLNAYNSILKYCPRADDPLLILQKQNHKRNVKSNLEKIRIITKHYKKKNGCRKRRVRRIWLHLMVFWAKLSPLYITQLVSLK